MMSQIDMTSQMIRELSKNKQIKAKSFRASHIYSNIAPVILGKNRDLRILK
jgi:hypothetical protein